MPLRSVIWLTASTLLGCFLLILFLDQPVAWFTHRYLAGAKPFFAAYTREAEIIYSSVLMWPIGKIPLLFVSLIGAFVVVRVVLRRRWGTVFLLVLFTHIASQVSANVLKGVVHRLRPEVLFEKGAIGVGLWQSGPHNDSFPSAHAAAFFSLFWPFAVVFPRYSLLVVLLPGLICIGRLILGEHYVSDVWFAMWLVIAFTELFRWLSLASKALKNKALLRFRPSANL